MKSLKFRLLFFVLLFSCSSFFRSADVIDHSHVFLSSQKTINRAISPQIEPGDPRYVEQKNILDNIQLASAWDITQGSRQIIVAVIDDAIDIKHPDLVDNLMPGFDFAAQDNDPSPEECNGSPAVLEQHGTQVAGVIGAVGDNAIGISGVSWQVSIMPLRIGCQYPKNEEALAVKYAIEHGADIINASYGGPAALGGNQQVVDLLKAAEQQVLFVTAAGNEHVNTDEIPAYPASLGLSNVISVAASDDNNQLTEWTQYGPVSVDLAAPGVNVKTTTVDGAYGAASGSSFSTAIVSGVAALIKAKALAFNTPLSAPDLKAVLQASVTPVSGQNGLTKTAGIVNAQAALKLMDLPQPVVSVVNVLYDDTGSDVENGRLDALETGNLIVTLENLWDVMTLGSVAVTVNNPLVQLPARFFNLPSMQVGERFDLRIPVQTTEFSQHQRIRFDLGINATGTGKSVSYQRGFELQTGLLSNNVAISQQIQQTNQDDYHYYHVQVPANRERVAVELEYATSDTRDMGLLAMFDQRPQIYFAAFNGRPYWYSADYRSDAKTGFERINFRTAVNSSPNLNIMVFNQPAASASLAFESNKPYKLKACFYSDSDGNNPPRVNAGRDITVNEGDVVILSGEFTDSDGKIERSFWKSENNIAFTSLTDRQIRFEAKTGGPYTFSLTAIDNGCKHTVDKVKVTVKDITGNEPDGLILNPRTLNIEENSRVDVFVSAIFESKEVSDLRLVEPVPEGITFTNGFLSWRNASPAGTYFIPFSADVGNRRLSGTITINISKRRIGNGGGCVAMKTGEFDPLLLLYILLSWFFISKRLHLQKQSKP